MDGPEDTPKVTPQTDTHALLESVHTFPGQYQIKVIGTASDDFVTRLVSVAGEHMETIEDVVHRVRETPGGRHIAITLELHLHSAAQVHAIYESLRKVDGLTMLL